MTNPDLVAGTDWETGGFDFKRSRQTQNTIIALDGFGGWEPASPVFTPPNQIDVFGPLDANVAPAGWYMLTVVNANRLPSVARWVRVGQ